MNKLLKVVDVPVVQVVIWTRSLTCPLCATTGGLSSCESASDSIHRRNLWTVQFATETGMHSATVQLSVGAVHGGGGGDKGAGIFRAPPGLRHFSSTCPLPRYSHLEIWTSPSPSFLSVLRCLGVASGVRRIRDACFAWFNSGYMFYERLLANFTHFLRVVNSDPRRFLSIPQNGEVCTVNASSCSVSSRSLHFESGHYLYELSMSVLG